MIEVHVEALGVEAGARLILVPRTRQALTRSGSPPPGSGINDVMRCRRRRGVGSTLEVWSMLQSGIVSPPAPRTLLMLSLPQGSRSPRQGSHKRSA